MADAGLMWVNGQADLAIIDGIDMPGSELETNIVVSLFTDARSSKDIEDKRGYWGSGVGSLLWELFRETASQENLQRAIQYCKDALQWLVDDGIAASIEVTGVVFNYVGFAINVTIKRGTNKEFDYLFEGLEARSYEFNKSSLRVNYQI